jgi:hypothetical protein
VIARQGQNCAPLLQDPPLWCHEPAHLLREGIHIALRADKAIKNGTWNQGSANEKKERIQVLVNACFNG